MTLNLIMKRKVFAQIQVMCAKYEQDFNEKVATASVVNVLLAEALIARGLIPKDFIQKEYGCLDPIGQGFTAKARNERPKAPAEVQREQTELENKQKTFSMVLNQWADHPDKTWRENWFKQAEEWKEKIPNAKLILALKNGDAKN
jgi:hypothetical protein